MSFPNITSSFGHFVTIKLTRDNYLLWLTQIKPYLRSQHLLGLVDGTLPVPEKTITSGEGDKAKTVPNPAYDQWLLQDQLVLSAINSSLSPEVLGQVMRASTAREA